jgi:hypothetical protein
VYSNRSAAGLSSDPATVMIGQNVCNLSHLCHTTAVEFQSERVTYTAQHPASRDPGRDFEVRPIRPTPTKTRRSPMFGKAGSILLSIGKLPPQVSRKALKAHVQEVIDDLDGNGFRLAPTIASCDILRLTNPVTGEVTHQGLVSIQPAGLAFRVMEALQQKPLRGRPLQVRRYRHSSFPVKASTPLISMSDLLGVSAEGETGQTTRLKLDLVADTGPHKPSEATPSQAKADHAFAH